MQADAHLAAAGEDVDGAVVVLADDHAVGRRRLGELVDLLAERGDVLARLAQGVGELLVLATPPGPAGPWSRAVAPRACAPAWARRPGLRRRSTTSSSSAAICSRSSQLASAVARSDSWPRGSPPLLGRAPDRSAACYSRRASRRRRCCTRVDHRPEAIWCFHGVRTV